MMRSAASPMRISWWERAARSAQASNSHAVQTAMREVGDLRTRETYRRARLTRRTAIFLPTFHLEISIIEPNSLTGPALFGVEVPSKHYSDAPAHALASR